MLTALNFFTKAYPDALSTTHLKDWISARSRKRIKWRSIERHGVVASGSGPSYKDFAYPVRLLLIASHTSSLSPQHAFFLNRCSIDLVSSGTG
jgi:hypothetical protein